MCARGRARVRSAASARPPASARRARLRPPACPCRPAIGRSGSRRRPRAGRGCSSRPAPDGVLRDVEAGGRCLRTSKRSSPASSTPRSGRGAVAGVLGGVLQRLEAAEVDGGLDLRRVAADPVGPRAVSGTGESRGELAQRVARGRARSAATGRCPSASARMSSMVSLGHGPELVQSARRPPGHRCGRALGGRASLMRSATSRCCAPSCRSRSIRRRASRNSEDAGPRAPQVAPRPPQLVDQPVVVQRDGGDRGAGVIEAAPGCGSSAASWTSADGRARRRSRMVVTGPKARRRWPRGASGPPAGVDPPAAAAGSPEGEIEPRVPEGPRPGRCAVAVDVRMVVAGRDGKPLEGAGAEELPAQQADQERRRRAPAAAASIVHEQVRGEQRRAGDRPPARRCRTPFDEQPRRRRRSSDRERA